MQVIEKNTNIVNQEESKDVGVQEKQQKSSFNNVNNTVKEVQEKLQEETKEQAQEIEKLENNEQLKVISLSKHNDLNKFEVLIDKRDCQPKEIDITTELGKNIENISNNKLNEKKKEVNVKETEREQTFPHKNIFKELNTTEKEPVGPTGSFMFHENFTLPSE